MLEVMNSEAIWTSAVRIADVFNSLHNIRRVNYQVEYSINSIRIEYSINAMNA